MSQDTQKNPGNRNSGANNSIPKKNTDKNNINNYKNSVRAERMQKLFIRPVRNVARQIASQRNATMEPM